MKFAKSSQTRLLGVPATSNILLASVTYAHTNEQPGGAVSGSISGDPRCQNLDVPEVPLFGVKIHINVNFSALASSRLLKMHKSSGFGTTYAKLQKFRCWDTCKILHDAQLNFDFFVVFTSILSKTAANIFQSLVLLALLTYTTNITFCGRHDGATCLRLFLLERFRPVLETLLQRSQNVAKITRF